MKKKALGTDKDVEKLADKARSQGFIVEQTKGNHIRFLPPDKEKQIVVTSLTSSDRRTVQNLKSRLRRSGLKD